MNKKYIILILTTLFLYACQKNSETPPPPSIDNSTVNEYFPMKVGNFWAYEFVNKLPDGTIVGTTTMDTLKVVNDTIINDNKYFEFNTNKPTSNRKYFYRDSLGYILNTQGRIILLPDPDEVIYYFHYGYSQGDTVYSYWEEFPGEFTLTSNFGTHQTIAQIVTHNAWPNYGGQTVKDTTFYSEIGPLKRSYSYLSGTKMHGTLVDYHIEE